MPLNGLTHRRDIYQKGPPNLPKNVKVTNVCSFRSGNVCSRPCLTYPGASTNATPASYSYFFLLFSTPYAKCSQLNPRLPYPMPEYDIHQCLKKDTEILRIYLTLIYLGNLYLAENFQALSNPRPSTSSSTPSLACCLSPCQK